MAGFGYGYGFARGAMRLSSAGGVAVPTEPVVGMATWINLADTATLFADAVGGTPATVDGPLLAVQDKSGNGNHWTGTDTVMAADGGVLNGTSGFLALDALAASLTGDFTMMVVLKPAVETLGTTRTYLSLGDSASSNSYQYFGAAASALTAQRRGTSGGAGTASSAGAVQTVGTDEIWILRRSGTTLRLIKDGFAEQVAATQNNGTVVFNRLTLGARRGATASGFASGTLKEAVIYTTALSDAELASLDAYARSVYWGETTKQKMFAAITGGQSLKSGRATDHVTNTPTLALRSAYELDYSANTTRIGKNPWGNDGRSGGGGGYLPAIADTLYDNGDYVSFILNVSEGGTGLLPAVSGNGNWSTIANGNLYSGGTTKLADRMRTKALAFHERCAASPRYNYPGGLLIGWDQWNNDGGDVVNETANTYSVDGKASKGAYVAELISLKDYVASSGAPILGMYCVGPGGHAATVWPAEETPAVTIRTAQIEAMEAIDNGFMSSIRAREISSILNGYMGDGTHYRMPGNNFLGVDVATNLLTWLPTLSVPSVGTYITLVDKAVSAVAGATAKFKVLRHGSLVGAVSVDYAVTGGLSASGTVSFADGEQIKTVDVVVPGGTADGVTYTCALSNPVGATLRAIGGTNSGVATVGGAVVVTLGNISLDAGTATVGAAWSSALVGTTAGSTVTITSSTGDTITVTSGVASGTFTSLPATLTIVETLAGATNTPYTTTPSPTVSLAGGALPASGLYANHDFTDTTKLFKAAGLTGGNATVAGDVVASVEDSTGNGHHLTATGSPVLGGIGSKTAVTLNGTSQYFRPTNSTDIAAAMTPETSAWSLHFAVFQAANAQAAGRGLWGTSHSSGTSRQGATTNSATPATGFQSRNTAGTSATTIALGTPTKEILEVWSYRRKSDGTLDVLKNGASVYSGASQASAYSVLRYALGARLVANVADTFFSGQIGQQAIYSAAQSDADFASAHDFLRTKFA